MQKTIKIEGMSCGHCEQHVKKELESLSGINSVEVSADKGTAELELETEVEMSKIKDAVEKAGYEFIEII
ncbi:MAG: heavy-metal-associated domain-containing protein [Bacillota bacterium]